MRKKNKLIFGVGINDANYEVYKTEVVNGKSKKVWSCPYYLCWVGMLLRGYYDTFKKKYPTYKDVKVVEEWHRFSNFKAWMEKQDWEGKELDKDLLVRGNKLYSPQTCIFVEQKINTFLNERSKVRGDFPLGVSFEKDRNKFKARCSDPETGKDVNLGRYEDPNDAHKAWLSYKLEKAKSLAASQDDPRVAAALIDRYENYKGD